ncbi:MAG: M15 family metallopeptidase [Flavobacteriaceae bacterium]|nr:M15 family metallopeptidase [Bacteroidia bacterium]NNL16240.1 M15 family metallopeptidase [Flavobacteriaceae bacterium]
MRRRSFIEISSLLPLALAIIPNYVFSAPKISWQELIGKGNPELFGDGYKLRKEAYDSFLKMKESALKDGIDIQVVSGYRDFYHQRRIWNRKYKLFTQQGLSEEETIEKIIEYSTIPGTSRHHWGTDLDIIDGNSKQPKKVLLTRHFEENGPYFKLKNWMDEHANSFGFYLVYTNSDHRKGFKYEPWHYSFKPLSKVYLNEFLEIDILEQIKNENILGFDHFSKNFIGNYLNNNILDINPELLP